MKTLLKKMTAGLLSACMLTGMLPPLPSASAAETEASVRDTFRSLIYSAWENHQSQISVRSLRLPLDTAANLYYEMLYTDAEWFYVGSAFKYSTVNAWPSPYIGTIQIEYNYDVSQLDTMKAEFEAKVSEILSGVQPEWTNAEKVLYLHDYLADHAAYDLTFTYNDAYSALIGGTTVCQGYSLAMCVLCRRLNIPCYAITSDELNHMWNVVNIDGIWYHCDATYDDGAPDMIGHGTHNYVLVSDAYMKADSHHAASDWNYFSEDNVITCDSDAYSGAFWNGALDTVTPMPDGSWFYAKAADPSTVRFESQVTATFCRSRLMNETETLGTVKAAWPTPNGTVYSICYVSSQIYDGTVYYHDANSIYAMSPESGSTSASKIYTLTDAEKALGSIYGISIDNAGTLTYQIMASPAFESEDNLTMDVTYHTLNLTPQQTVPTSETTTTTTTTTITTTTRPTTTTTTTTTTRPTTTTMTTTTTTTRPTTTTTTTTRPTTTTTTTTTTRPTTTTTTTTTTRLTTSTTTSATVTTTTRRSHRTTTTTTASETTVTTTRTEETSASTFSSDTTGSETTTTTTVTTVPVSKLRGDVNLDDTVDVSDAVLLARFVAEDPEVLIQRQGIENGKCTDDNDINGDDVLYILKVIAHLIEN